MLDNNFIFLNLSLLASVVLTNHQEYLRRKKINLILTPLIFLAFALSVSFEIFPQITPLFK